ncbi:MAG: hypothetical protein WDW38_000858 [Sanguina aurantia]
MDYLSLFTDSPQAKSAEESMATVPSDSLLISTFSWSSWSATAKAITDYTTKACEPAAAPPSPEMAIMKAYYEKAMSELKEQLLMLQSSKDEMEAACELKIANLTQQLSRMSKQMSSRVEAEVAVCDERHSQHNYVLQANVDRYTAAAVTLQAQLDRCSEISNLLKADLDSFTQRNAVLTADLGRSTKTITQLRATGRRLLASTFTLKQQTLLFENVADDATNPASLVKSDLGYSCRLTCSGYNTLCTKSSPSIFTPYCTHFPAFTRNPIVSSAASKKSSSLPSWVGSDWSRLKTVGMGETVVVAELGDRCGSSSSAYSSSSSSGGSCGGVSRERGFTFTSLSSDGLYGSSSSSSGGGASIRAAGGGADGGSGSGAEVEGGVVVSVVVLVTADDSGEVSVKFAVKGQGVE